MDDRCKACAHFGEMSEYDWCHECNMECDHYKPLDELNLRDRRINYLRYSINPYYGPPIDADRVASTRYSYMLTIPYPLRREQQEILLRIIQQMVKTTHPDMDGLELYCMKLEG